MNDRRYSNPAGRIIIFAKEPVMGRVKTRLASSIGDDAALQLHVKMVTQTVEMVTNSGIADAELHVSGDIDHPLFQSLSSRFDIPLRRQHGDNLGERMHRALKTSLEEREFSVLIGTDIPAMSGQYIASAFAAVEQGVDIVIGPAEDGGYVLLGASRVDAGWFEGIDWGSPAVLQQSRQKVSASGASYKELPPLWDVDYLQDLQRWQLLQAAQQ